MTTLTAAQAQNGAGNVASPTGALRIDRFHGHFPLLAARRRRT
ncbi:hypothetical protein [Micromonospora sp. 15K316]|nr:hypothetical protein [Micromonospora sp. 15K316]